MQMQNMQNNMSIIDFVLKGIYIYVWFKTK